MTSRHGCFCNWSSHFHGLCCWGPRKGGGRAKGRRKGTTSSRPSLLGYPKRLKLITVPGREEKKKVGVKDDVQLLNEVEATSFSLVWISVTFSFPPFFYFASLLGPRKASPFLHHQSPQMPIPLPEMQTVLSMSILSWNQAHQLVPLSSLHIFQMT